MPKSNKIQLALCVALFSMLCFGLSLTARATTPAPVPTPTPTPPLNTIKIGQCQSSTQIEGLIAFERQKGNVIDVRPFAINQSTGQLFFSGSTGRFSVVHMNPFAFDYRITVAQEELVTTALSDFLKLLLPPNLSTLPGLQSGRAGAANESLATPAKLKQIEDRLDGLKPAACKSSADPAGTKTPACIAMGEMYETFTSLRANVLLGADALSPAVLVSPPVVAGALPVPRAKGETAFLTITRSWVMLNAGGTTDALDAYRNYTTRLSRLRNEQADTFTVCQGATDLNTMLATYNFESTLNYLDEAQKVVEEVTSLAKDLEQTAGHFKADPVLKEAKADPVDTNIVIRCKGYNCADQFDAYAKAALEILGVYGREITALRENTVRMQEMYQRTEQMKQEEGHFARTNTIIKKFELSQAKITVARLKIDPARQGQTQSGDAGGSTARSGASPQPVVSGGTGSEGTAPVASGSSSGTDTGQGGAAGETGGGNSGAQGAANNLAPSGQINEVIQIGQPRFALSGGLVYSPLPRRTFQSVKGFTRDAQGNPTGNGSADVVGYGENSSRRISPMVLLNTRLTNFEPANLYFSWGVSAKHDGNFDIEYLFGPSVSLLNDRAFFTFGAYGGQTQNLVADVAVGDALPDTIGDAKLYRKSLTWKPGFSFSYNFSRTKKANAAAAGTTGAPSAASEDLKSELRIGSIPFNLALGLAYTSLEQRTYDEVVGFARDRQGNLTNGRTLTRIVGQTSSSNYRLTPLVLLHSRLTNFGERDFYFSTGVTGKKTDNNFDIEYLLGGSVNLYRRKAFLTLGIFAGKQHVLGGDFFEGAVLGKTQNVTIQNRYVWKPALSFSYDISRIIKRGQQ